MTGSKLNVVCLTYSRCNHSRTPKIVDDAARLGRVRDRGVRPVRQGQHVRDLRGRRNDYHGSIIVIDNDSIHSK